MECNFCSKTFKTISSLKNHKVSAKYCLKIQGKIDVIETPFECNYCNKILSSKQMLQLHLISCNAREIFIEKDKEMTLLKQQKDKEMTLLKQQKDKEMALLKQQKDKEMALLKEELIKINIINNQFEKKEINYKEQIAELQKTIERMGTKAIEKPTTTNNTTTNNNTKINLVPFDLTNEYVSNIITSKFNDVHVLEGVHGLAKFVKDKIITLDDGTLVYRCFDTSRQIFKYQDKNGNLVKDPKALKLIELIQPALKEQTNTLYDFFNTEIHNYKKEEDEKRNEFLTTKDKMIFLKENTIKIQDEIADMHMNSRFCNELSAMTS